jgi:hypothetical protein
MLSQKGNPSMHNFAATFDAVRHKLEVGIKVPRWQPAELGPRSRCPVVHRGDLPGFRPGCMAAMGLVNDYVVGLGRRGGLLAFAPGRIRKFE